MQPGTFFSFAQWAKNYKLSWLRHDIVAGLAVFILIVPSGIAHSSLAGLSLAAGLFATASAMLVYALFTSSRTLIIGTEATSALLVAQAVTAVYSGGDAARFAALAAMLAAMAGVFIFLAGILKAGALAGFITRPVLVGYVNGIALIIIASQLGKLVDIPFNTQDFFPVLSELYGRVNEINYFSLAFGLIAIGILVLMKQVYRKFPTMLIVTILSIVAYSVFDMEKQGIKILGLIEGGLPLPAIPMVTWSDVFLLIPAAIGITLVIFPDIVLTSQYFALKNGYKINADRELMALGLGNIASGLYHGFSIGAQQSRTIVNEDAGAKTPLSSIVAAMLILVFMLFFTPLLKELPHVTLAAILIVAAMGLLDVKSLGKFWRFRKFGMFLSLITTAAVLVFGVIEGIFAAVLISGLYVMVIVAKPNDAVLSGDTLKEIPGDEPVQPRNGILIYRFQGPVFSPNVNYFKERMLALMMTPGLKNLVLDTMVILNIDFAAAETLKEIHSEYKKRGIRIVICNASSTLLGLCQRAGITELIGKENFYKDLDDTLKALNEKK